MSTACSSLCARCVRPSFIFVIRASSRRYAVASTHRRTLSWGILVHFRPVFTRRRLDARRRRHLLEKLLVAGATVTPHDRSQRRVGFQRRGIHSRRRAVQQLALPQDLKHPAEPISILVVRPCHTMVWFPLARPLELSVRKDGSPMVRWYRLRYSIFDVYVQMGNALQEIPVINVEQHRIVLLLTPPPVRTAATLASSF